MKKRIVFQLFMLFILTLQIQAMEKLSIDKPQNPSVPVNNICYFLRMPRDVCHYIVRFLVWESQKYFEQRITIPKKVPDEYCKILIDNAVKCMSWNNDAVSENINAVFSPDETKIALWGPLCPTCNPSKVMIIDITKENKEEKIMYNGALTEENYCPLGLSTSGNMIAVIKRQETVSNNNCHMQCYYDVLTIQKMVNKEEEKEFKEIKRFAIPEGFTAQQLDFNKQNSHLIMHGHNRKKFFKPKNISFSLQDFTLKDKITGKEKPIFVSEDNELFNYFKYKGVCKERKKIGL